MVFKIDLNKLFRFFLKRIFIPIICIVVGFMGMYTWAETHQRTTYTAYATMYVYNGNPNAINYQYTTMADMNAAVLLMDTYMVVIRSNKVMDTVAEQLLSTLGIMLTNDYISSSLSMGAVGETGVMQIFCTTEDPVLSMEICNAVVDVAPAEIIRVVSAGSAEVIDYAELPKGPNASGAFKRGVFGALIGCALSVGVLLIVFLMKHKIETGKEWEDNYNVALLSSIPKQQTSSSGNYLIQEDTSSKVVASYAKLRMNLYFTMQNGLKTLLVSSAVPGESKSTVSANLAISFAMDGKRVLLIDGDMRSPSLEKMFQLNNDEGGLSDMLVHASGKMGKIWENVRPNLDILTAGTVPPNPAELLNSPDMHSFLAKAEEEYDLIVIDTPPINAVPDALVLADEKVGLLYIVRINYSDHREVRKALAAIEFSKINLLGAAMSFSNKSASGYYYNHYYYNRYYGEYDKRRKRAHHHQNHGEHSSLERSNIKEQPVSEEQSVSENEQSGKE